MTKVTLMAGNSRFLCRTWHALQELERSRSEKCRAPGCPVKSEGERKSRRSPGSEI